MTGEGKEVYEGGCIYSPERGQKPNPSFQLGSNWKDSSGRADVGPRYRWRSPGLVQQGGFPQGPPSRFHFLFWVFRNCRAPPRPHAPFGCGKGGAQVLQTWVLQGLNYGPPRRSLRLPGPQYVYLYFLPLPSALTRIIAAISMRAEARMEVVKQRRGWGWRWGKEPDGIDP